VLTNQLNAKFKGAHSSAKGVKLGTQMSVEVGSGMWDSRAREWVSFGASPKPGSDSQGNLVDAYRKHWSGHANRKVWKQIAKWPPKRGDQEPIRETHCSRPVG